MQENVTKNQYLCHFKYILDTDEQVNVVNTVNQWVLEKTKNNN